MPKRDDIQKILLIGSGLIIIGQACEFDYSGTQACKALREESHENVLVNKVNDGEMARALRLDSLGYLSLEGMLGCVSAHPPEDYCCACFSGDYPVEPETGESPS